MTADHLPVWQWGVGSLAVTAVLALTGCTGPATPSAGSTPLGGGAAGTPSTSGPKPRAAKPPSTNRKTADVVADCPVGRWRLRATAPTAGGPVENVSFSGRDAFDLAFDDDDGWRMIGNRKAPLKATVEVAGLPLSGSAAIAGTARGRYRMAKSVAVFRLERTSGDVDVTYPGGRQTYGMETLAGALVPDGAADLTCRGNSLTIEAENLTLYLRRVRR
ncbi:MAG TPA: hypothetical protein VK401_03850 [Propionibacteriaceae bacterium]|jgi:hypothetical protein|nr:hypothetical protein [Propionibacteriaceae bacterium]